MFGTKYAVPAFVAIVLALGAAPVALAIENAMDDNDYDLVTIEGEVTAFLYDDYDEDDQDDLDDEDGTDDADDEPEENDDEEEDADEDESEDEPEETEDDVEDESEDDMGDDPEENEDDLNDAEDDSDEDDEKNRPAAFVVDDEIIVEFGPWWYWMAQEVSVIDVIEVGDQVNVTGEMYETDDGMWVMCAWVIVDVTDPDNPIEITIREEGRPPWAGGPLALGIDPWPPSDEDE